MVHEKVDQVTLSERIERAYAESGNKLGWRLLASPVHVLDGAEVAFLGLNPGGKSEPPEHPKLAMPEGSAYVVENWDTFPAGKSPLQVQVRALFDGLGVQPEHVLAGHLVPFRLPDWASLRNPEAALRFGEKLWSEIFSRARPKLVIGMGNPVRDALPRLLGARDLVSVPVNWGTVTGSRAQFDGGTFVGLPHLSRYKIMHREESAVAIRELFDGYWRTSDARAFERVRTGDRQMMKSDIRQAGALSAELPTTVAEMLRLARMAAFIFCNCEPARLAERPVRARLRRPG